MVETLATVNELQAHDNPVVERPTSALGRGSEEAHLWG